MEHRCAVRKPIALDVTLNYRGLGLISGKTQDVGLGGMFINVGRVQLAINALVDITFPVKCPTKSMQCKAKALVVHHRADGVGLMFSELDTNVRQMLRRVLNGQVDTAITRPGLAPASSPGRAIGI